MRFILFRAELASHRVSHLELHIMRDVTYDFFFCIPNKYLKIEMSLVLCNFHKGVNSLNVK